MSVELSDGLVRLTPGEKEYGLQISASDIGVPTKMARLYPPQ